VVKITGKFGSMYDKAGLMVRLDEENWILTGLEYFNDRINHSTSVTRDFTDWSISPLPDVAQDAGAWFCFKRNGKWFETFHSIEGKSWVQTRQGFFTDQQKLQVGICGACPTGTGFKVLFDHYRLKRKEG
jgi:regulation of enolase protein 1 (concanavalin A-like superfamily)